MEVKLLLIATFSCLLKYSGGQSQHEFCQSQGGSYSPQPMDIVTVMLRTSSPSNGPFEYSNDNGNCGCRVTVIGNMTVSLKVTSRLTVPNRAKEEKNNGNNTCGPLIMNSRRTKENVGSVLAFQCPLIPMENDTARYFLDAGPQESLMFALVNQRKDEVRSQINITLLAGTIEVQCGQMASVSGCPCSHAYYYDGPTTRDARLASRFIAAIVASVGFLVLCAIIFCTCVACRNRRARKQDAEEAKLPPKSGVDGSENKAYTGSEKSIDSKPAKPDKKPRTKFSSEKTSPEKTTPEKPTKESSSRLSYIPYSSEDALNLSLQHPNVSMSPSGIGSIIGTADIRGSTESGIYSSADLIGPDQMYKANGTPNRAKPNVMPRTPSKEELDAMYAKPHKEYYSNVPGFQAPAIHQTAALPPRSASQDRLESLIGRGAGSGDRLDQPYRAPSQDRLDQNRRVPSQDRLDQNRRVPSQDRLDQPYRIPSQERLDQNRRYPSQDHLDQSHRVPSQDRLDQTHRARSQDRLDQTPMTQRVPSQDRLDRDNAAFVPEQRPYHGSNHSLDETDV